MLEHQIRLLEDMEINAGVQAPKGQIITECPYEIIVSPKIATKKISEISALAYKERSSQKLY